MAFLLWLNGPGLRWIAPKVAVHYLQKAGIRGDFKVGGNLVGGLSLSDLRIEGDGALASLTIDRIRPDYEWRGLVKGELKGLSVEGVHAELRLGLEKKEEEKPPLDLKKLVETIRMARTRAIPLELDIKDLSLTASRDGKPELKLDPSRISHKAGEDVVTVELGNFTDATGRVWEGRQSEIVWKADELSVVRLDPLPGVSVREFVMQLPAGGEPSAEAQLHLDNAVLMLSGSPGFASVKVDLREGNLQLDETVARFGIELPAKANLTSLAVEVDNLLPDPKAATGKAGFLLDTVTMEDWSVSQLSMDATLGADQAGIITHGNALGSGFSVEGSVPVIRGEKSFLLGDAKGKFAVEDIPKVVRQLSPRVPAIDPQAPVPSSTAVGDFTVSFAENKPTSVAASVILKPLDEKVATAVAVKGRWVKDQPVEGEISMDGLRATAVYQTTPGSYEATASLLSFTSKRIEPWLAIAKVKPGGTADLTGEWKGSGEVKEGQHRGDVQFTQANWSRVGAETVTAIGGARYDWPGSFETKGLRVQAGEQVISVDAALSQGMLDLRRFLWSRGTEELAEGSASLPVPEDFTKWREMIVKDERPVSVYINSRVLSLANLKPWVKGLDRLDPRSTGQLSIDLSGTYGKPELKAKFEARDLSSPEQPKLKPADLVLEITGKDERLEINGNITTPDFAPAVLKASMPFKPARWAEFPEEIKQEPVEARADLPRLDLARFATLVPSAEKLEGILTGNVTVAGKVEKPEIKGTIDLNGAGLKLKNSEFPPIQQGSASLDFALDKVVVRKLQATVAAGTVRGEGSVAITDGKPGAINLRVQGSQLPVLRNDLMIVRANADLRLQGTWEKSVLSGTVGAVDGIFYRDIEILPIGRPFTGPSAAALPKIDTPKAPGSAIPEPFRNWGMDVTVKLEDAFLIRGNLATGEVTGSMKIRGTIGTPAPDGQFKINDFKASLPFSTLSVPRGTVSFAPSSGFDPILEIRGTAEPRPYMVTVYAYGGLSDPQLVLTSNPPLPENEIMTLLATGTTTSGLEDPSAASSLAMQLLAREFLHGRVKFGNQLKPLVKLMERVNFSLSDTDPYSSETYSTATIALTDKWFISTGMGATGDTRVLAIWRLSFR